MRSAPSTSTLPRSAASEQPDDPYKVDAAAEVATTTVDTPDNGNTKSSTVRTLTSTSEVSASDGVDVIAQVHAVTGAVESDDGVLDKTDSETAVMNDGGSDVLCDGDNSGIGVLELLRAAGLEPRGRSDQAEEVHNTKREQHKVAPRVVHKAVISKEEEKRMKKQQEREDKERKEKAAKEAKAKKEQHKEAEATKKGDKSHLSNAP